MLAARGILDKVKNKMNQVEKTAEEYKNKAKGTTIKPIKTVRMFLFHKKLENISFTVNCRCSRRPRPPLRE